MRYCVAPLEGLTGVIFRRIHHRFFPGADKYYTPFLPPAATMSSPGGKSGRSCRNIMRACPWCPSF